MTGSIGTTEKNNQQNIVGFIIDKYKMTSAFYIMSYFIIDMRHKYSLNIQRVSLFSLQWHGSRLNTLKT